MTSQKLLSVSHWLPVAALLLASLTSNNAVQAQTSSNRSVLPYLPHSVTAGLAAKQTSRFKNALAALPTGDSSSALPRFIAHREYVAADGPGNPAMGDLNGDGIADLVVPNANTNNVSVLLGNRDGSFQQFHLFDTGGAGPFDVVIADFNGDGKNDVAVTNAAGVGILLGDGKGHLGKPIIFPVGTIPSRLVAADFDGDHKLDLAVTNFDSNNVSILLGKGDGTFAPAVNLPVGMGPLGIAVGDFNHDGKADLAVANSGVADGNNKGPHANTLAILLGDGKGGFHPPTFIPVAKTPLAVLVSDFNKDNKQDLAVTSQGKGLVSELLGNGDGTFQVPRLFSVVLGPNNMGANNMSVADFNGDGNLDLAVTNDPMLAPADIVILFGDGKGNFKPAVRAPAGRAPVAVLASDFNHDGKADYVTTNADSNTVAVVLGKGNGSFFDIGPGIADASLAPGGIITADFNHDGIPDLAVSDTGLIGEFGNKVSILLGKKDGSFETGKLFETGTQPIGLAATDFDHDGNLDLVVASFGNFPVNGGVSLLLGNGDGTFQSPRNFRAGDFPVGIAVADFNGDGNPDVVVTDFGTNVGTPGISLLLGDGKDGFSSPKRVITFPEFTQPQRIVAADFNGDGKVDIAYITNQVFVQLGNGDGTFQAPIAIPAANSASFVVADLNHDGIPDLVIEESGQVEVLLGDGKGQFTSVGTFSEGTASGFSAVPNLVVADFNGDGILDVAAPDGFGETVSLLLGNGDGTLGIATLFAGGLTDSAVAVDLNGAQPSIALATELRQVRILRNMTTSK